MRNNVLLISLVNICLSASAYALSPDEFDVVEYHVNTGVGNTLAYDSDEISPDFKKKFNFVKLDATPSLKLATYIDTPDRALKKHNINIRVRENVTTPRKSKITVKLRADDPTSFGSLKGYTKAETDYTEGVAAYSVSYDVPYSPGEIDVKKVDFVALASILRKNSAVWDMLGSVYDANQPNLKQTNVMRIREWDGQIDDKRFSHLEVNFQTWTPYYRQPRVSFAEFSFKGNVKDKVVLEQAYDYLFQKSKAVGLDAGFTGSKTAETFNMSKDFK